MNRRGFITLIPGAVVAGPLIARAQSKMPTIGVLVLGSPAPEPFLMALREGLQKVGYIEGQNIRMEFRSAGGQADLLPDAAAELVRLNVDIIVAWQTPAAQSAKQATNEIPIVMAGVGDPVGTGLVASLARPGANVTGSSTATEDVVGKSLQFVREIIPSVRRVAVLCNATDSFTKVFLAQIELAARTVGIEIQPIMVRPAEEFDTAFAEMQRKQVDAVIVQGSVIRKEVADLALKHRLPSVAANRLLPAMGGLMSYAANFAELYRETAVYIDKILKGRLPADLPVQQPTRFELVINLKTAEALGLKIPPSILARADEVIE